jgi:hypothetical protein
MRWTFNRCIWYGKSADFILKKMHHDCTVIASGVECMQLPSPRSEAALVCQWKKCHIHSILHLSLSIMSTILSYVQCVHIHNTHFPSCVASSSFLMLWKNVCFASRVRAWCQYIVDPDRKVTNCVIERTEKMTVIYRELCPPVFHWL